MRGVKRNRSTGLLARDACLASKASTARLKGHHTALITQHSGIWCIIPTKVGRYHPKGHEADEACEKHSETLTKNKKEKVVQEGIPVTPHSLTVTQRLLNLNNQTSLPILQSTQIIITTSAITAVFYLHFAVWPTTIIPFRASFIP